MRVRDLMHLHESHTVGMVRSTTGALHVTDADTEIGLCGKGAPHGASLITAGDDRTICKGCAKLVPSVPEDGEESSVEEPQGTSHEDTARGEIAIPETHSDATGEDGGNDEGDQNAMASLIVLGAKTVAAAVRSRVSGTREIAGVLLDMRTRILDKDGDIDLRAATNEAKSNSASMYQMVREAIQRNPDHEAHGLLGQVTDIQRGVQTAMTDEVVHYVRGLDASPAEFAKYTKARDAFPDLSPSEAVWAYYEQAGKPLPKLTRAELAREKRRLAKEAKTKVSSERIPQEPAEDTTEEAEPETQHLKDLEAIKAATKTLTGIAQRAAQAAGTERNEVKERLEQMLNAVTGEVAPL